MKRILVIGANSAIAHACARRWAAPGTRFFLVGRNQDKLQHNAQDLQTRGAEVNCHTLDATDFGAHGAMLESAVAFLGELDIALVAHGTLPDQTACEKDAGVAMQEFAANGTSVIALLTVLANQFERQHQGTLAVISSVAGDRGRPSNYLYGSAKAAVTAFCQGLRARLFKQGVQVLTIKPGFVDTPMTQDLELPALLLATPEQVARRIDHAIARQRAVVYTPGFWALIMLVIRHIPEFIFKRLSL